MLLMSFCIIFGKLQSGAEILCIVNCLGWSSFDSFTAGHIPLPVKESLNIDHHASALLMDAYVSSQYFPSPFVSSVSE